MSFSFFMRRFFMPVLLCLLLMPFGIVFAGDDAHFIQPDDYFISKEEFKNQSWIYVYLAKMIQPAAKETKNEANFMKVTDGSKMWTRFFWKTRIAVKDDIKIGLKVIMPEISGDEDVYRAPANKEEARSSSWFMAVITDVSDMYKGYVTVSGGYKVSLQALRVMVVE